MIPPFPRRLILVPLILDRCGHPVVTMATLPLGTSAPFPREKAAVVVTTLPWEEHFPDSGGKAPANAALPRDTFPEADLLTKGAPLSTKKMFSDLEGHGRRWFWMGDFG